MIDLRALMPGDLLVPAPPGLLHSAIVLSEHPLYDNAWAAFVTWNDGTSGLGTVSDKSAWDLLSRYEDAHG